MRYRTVVGPSTFRFDGLRAVLGKAGPARSGDELAGVGAESDRERVAARAVLADVPLSVFLQELVVPYEDDEVTRLIVDGHDAVAF
jgi:ethanolamine ammonia-lyase large subunit